MHFLFFTETVYFMLEEFSETTYDLLTSVHTYWECAHPIVHIWKISTRRKRLMKKIQTAFHPPSHKLVVALSFKPPSIPPNPPWMELYAITNLMITTLTCLGVESEAGAVVGSTILLLRCLYAVLAGQ